MTLDDPNPYATPLCVDATSIVRIHNRSVVLAAVSSVYCAALISFTVVLLRSSSLDHTTGMLFLINVPFLMGLVISSTLSTRVGAWFGLTVVGVHSVITIAMLIIPIGDAATVTGINPPADYCAGARDCWPVLVSHATN